ncbi:MAG: hypothetical protein WCS03_17805, partial [Bacteroidota bacterium]
KLKSYYKFLATEHQIKFSPAFTRGQILNPYLPHYKIAFAFFILLYLHGIVPPSPEAYHMHREPYRLTTFRSNNRMG